MRSNGRYQSYRDRKNPLGSRGQQNRGMQLSSDLDAPGPRSRYQPDDWLEWCLRAKVSQVCVLSRAKESWCKVKKLLSTTQRCDVCGVSEDEEERKRSLMAGQGGDVGTSQFQMFRLSSWALCPAGKNSDAIRDSWQT
jgi:hypothetical protein